MRNFKLLIPVTLIAFFVLLDAGCTSGAKQTAVPEPDVINADAAPADTAVPEPYEPEEFREVVLQPVKGKFVGNVWANDTDTIPLFKTLWNQVTPENAGKWSMAEPVRDEMRWNNLDEAYKLAKDNNFPFRLHTLVWGNQQPAWIGELSPEEQAEEIEEWFRLLSERYPEIDMIDVVNEPLHQPPVYIEGLGGKGPSGWDWVINSFTLARKYFPKSMLCLNEYNVMTGGENTSNYIKLIRLLQGRGLIDGVGLQGHFLEHTATQTLKFNLDRVAEVDLPLYITEFDLEYGDDAMQAVRMRDVFTMLWEHEAVKGITFWGYLENWTWRGKAYLMFKDRKPRSALYWLEGFLNGKKYKIPRSRTGALMGTPDRVIIEAEDFTKAEGVEKTDSCASGIAAGDMMMFEKVALRLQYEKITVRYARGADSPAKLLVRLNAPDSDVVAEISLPKTGGPDKFSEVNAPYSAQEEGFFDIYVECESGEDAGLIDLIIIGLE
ncbi:MAG: endo-1,4-beta-xylanase [Spirochaetales bacterium]|nr:endo-1,4-beta-xylanase [Spirochaetales bacterium]